MRTYRANGEHSLIHRPQVLDPSVGSIRLPRCLSRDVSWSVTEVQKPTHQKFTKRGYQPFCASSFRILGTLGTLLGSLGAMASLSEHPGMGVYQMSEGACLEN